MHCGRRRLAVCGVLCCVYVVATWLLSWDNIHPQKPNIIFVLADDLGWADVGFNNPYVISPTLDKLAREGVILNQSYVTQTCSPTRAALMTGYYPFRLRYQAGGPGARLPFGVPLNLTFLPETLRRLSYSTYMVGKWHLGFCKEEYTPTRRGFDRFYGYYLAAGDHYSHTASGSLDLHDDLNPDRSQNGTYSSYLFTDKAVDFIDNHDRRKPMFMYLAYQSVHSPLQVPQKYYDMYPFVKNENRRMLLAMVTALDDGIGKVVKALKTNGLWDNTLFVFLSDNGAPQNEAFEGSNWPLLGTKGTLFEGGTRTVGLVHGKHLTNAGYINNRMIHIVDWYPTLVTVAGGKLNDPEMDGIDVWEALSRNEPSPRKELVYNIVELNNNAAIRIGNFKLLVGAYGEAACSIPPREAEGKLGNEYCRRVKADDVYLFNIKNDPLERVNLAEEMPAKLNELTERLEEHKRKLLPVHDGSTGTANKANPRNFGGVWSHGWC